MWSLMMNDDSPWVKQPWWVKTIALLGWPVVTSMYLAAKDVGYIGTQHDYRERMERLYTQQVDLLAQNRSLLRDNKVIMTEVLKTNVEELRLLRKVVEK